MANQNRVCLLRHVSRITMHLLSLSVFILKELNSAVCEGLARETRLICGGPVTANERGGDSVLAAFSWEPLRAKL